VNLRLAKTTAVIACLAAALLGGCGSSNDKGKPIPAATQQELDKQLDSVKARFDFGGGACSDIAQNKQSVQKTIDSLPDDTDSDVKSALQDGFDQLFQLTDEQCDEKKGQKTETETTPSEPAPTPTESAPETTPTTPSETTPAQTTPSDQKPKKQKEPKGGGNGGGNSAPQSGTGGGGVEAPGELP
jgi:hypothetical protein